MLNSTMSQKQLAKALDVRMNSRKLLYSKERRELRGQLFFWLPIC